MISAVCWVPRAAAATKPTFYEKDAETSQVSAANVPAGHISDAESGSLVEEQPRPKTPAEMMASLNMDTYDDEPGPENLENMLTSEKNLAKSFKLNAKDKKIVNNRGDGIDDDDHDDADEEDLEDYILKDTDRIVLAATTAEDEEYSTLEVQVYDTETGSLYVHHDITLPSFPLCLQHIQQSQSSSDDKSNSNNFVAVGAITPIIEIWNLDIVNPLEPVLQLEGHKDAVMSLDYNATTKSLVSGSADCCINIWDLNSSKILNSFKNHQDKVQVVRFNPNEDNILLTGGFDKSINVFSVMDSDYIKNRKVFKVDSDVESAEWSGLNPFQFVCSCENGKLFLFDLRKTEKEIVQIQAHKKKPCSSVSFSKKCPSLMATCSPDKSVKIWDFEKISKFATVAESVVKIDQESKPEELIILEKKDFGVGEVFDCDWCDDDAFLLAAGGTGGVLGNII